MYVGTDGLQISIIPVLSQDETEFLAFARANYGVSETVWPLSYHVEDDYYSYRTTRHGGMYGIVNASSGLVFAFTVANNLYDEAPKEAIVAASDDEVGEQEAERIITRYLAQRASGHTRTVQRWDRSIVEANHTKKAAEEAAALNKACGSGLTFQFDWANWSDERLQSPDISSCYDVPPLLATSCSLYPEVASQLQSFEELHCSMAGTPGLVKEQSQLRWTPASGNNRVLAEAGILEIFGLKQRIGRSADGNYFYLDLDATVAYSGSAAKLSKHRVVRANIRVPRLYRMEIGLFSGVGASSIVVGKSPWIVRCGRSKHEFTELSHSERDAFLSKVRLDDDYLFDREPFVLARDERGVYYYVDRVMDEKGGKDYRVYIGRKGATRKTLLKDVVDDSEGLIFETSGGKLRLRIDQNNSQVQHVFWSKRKKRTELTILNPKENGELIFRELGVYDGVALGTVCSLL